MNRRLPVETALSNLTGAVLAIAGMKPGETIGISPVQGPSVRVVCTRSISGTNLYTVAGRESGNVHGAAHALVIALAPYMQAAIEGAPLHKAGPRGDYDAMTRAHMRAEFEAGDVIECPECGPDCRCDESDDAYHADTPKPGRQ